MAGVPPLWIPLAEQDWPDVSGAPLRYVTNSGGAMPRATYDKLRKKLPRTGIHLMYGLTEAFRSTALPPSETDKRPSSVGKPIPNAEVLVVRPDGTPCAPNEQGEIVHRGAFVSKGYWRNPQATAERFKPVPQPDPSLPLTEFAVWSGDIGWYDEEGFLFFLGRRDEQIKTSGFRVSPTDVEDTIYSTHTVGEVVAFGIPHDVLGQQIVVVCTAPPGGKLDAERVRTKCREVMPTYMVPHVIVERDSLPRTPNGKMDRPRIAREFHESQQGQNAAQ
jgi:acyl-CoA synthetase (AMP-forming)/AMP-acid ligase II